MANWAKAGMILGQGIKETGTMIGGLMIKAEEKRKDRLYAEKLLKEQRAITTGAASRKEKGGYFKDIYSKKSGRYDTFLKDVVKRLWPTGTTTTALGEFAATVVKLEGPERDALLAELEKVRRMAEKAGAKWYMHVFDVNEKKAREAIASELADFGKTSDQIKKALGKVDKLSSAGQIIPTRGPDDMPIPGGVFNKDISDLTPTDHAARFILEGLKKGDFEDFFNELGLFLRAKEFGTETYGIPASQGGGVDKYDYRLPSSIDRKGLGKVTLADLGEVDDPATDVIEGEGSLRHLFEAALDLHKKGLIKAMQDGRISDVDRAGNEKERQDRLTGEAADKWLKKRFPELYSEKGKEKIFTSMIKNAEAAYGVAHQKESFDPEGGLAGYNPQYENKMLKGVNRQSPDQRHALSLATPHATQGGTVSVGEGRPQDPKYAGPLVEEGTYTYKMAPLRSDDDDTPSFSGSIDMEPEEEAWAAFEAGDIEADQPLNIYSQDRQNPNTGEYITKTVREMWPDRVAKAEQDQVTAPQKSGMINGQLGDAEPGMGSGIPKNWPVDKARHQTAYGADQRGADVGLNFGPGRGTNPDPDNFVGWGEDITSGGKALSPDAKMADKVPDAIYSNMSAPYEVQSEIPALPQMPFDASEVASVEGRKVKEDEVLESPFRDSFIVPIMKNGVLFYDVHTDRRDKPLGQMHAHKENNPIGVDKGINWHGLSADRTTQGRQAKFDDPMYAYRAAARIIGRDYRDKGITTTEGIIREWLKSENEYRQYQDFDKVVSNYLKVIQDVTGLEADAEVATIDDIKALLYGMTVEEMNGHFPYSMSVIREGIDNSGNWSFDKFENRLQLRPDVENTNPSLVRDPDALYLLNEDEISASASIDVLPADAPTTKKELGVYQRAIEKDFYNPKVYADVIINGGATIADLDGLPQDIREEVLLLLQEYNQAKTGQ